MYIKSANELSRLSCPPVLLPSSPPVLLSFCPPVPQSTTADPRLLALSPVLIHHSHPKWDHLQLCFTGRLIILSWMFRTGRLLARISCLNLDRSHVARMTKSWKRRGCGRVSQNLHLFPKVPQLKRERERRNSKCSQVIIILNVVLYYIFIVQKYHGAKTIQPWAHNTPPFNNLFDSKKAYQT